VSTLAIVLIVLAAIFVLFFLGGLVVERRRLRRPGFAADVARADRALESARAADRGWNRQVLDEAARQALAAERPEFSWSSLELVLVDDRPGVEEDRAHLLAVGDGGESARVVLARERDGSWVAEGVE
jgi:hypothetical protein